MTETALVNALDSTVRQPVVSRGFFTRSAAHIVHSLIVASQCGECKVILTLDIVNFEFDPQLIHFHNFTKIELHFSGF